MDYIIDTLRKQIKWRVLQLNGFKITRMSNVAVLVCKGNKSLCIRYNESSDLYDLSKHTKQPDKSNIIENLEDVYCDQLVDIIAEYFDIDDANYRKRFGSCINTDDITCVICGKPIRQGCESIVYGTDVNGPVYMQCLTTRLSK